MTTRIAEVTPTSEGWKFLSATIESLPNGSSQRISNANQETLVVLVSGSIIVEVAGTEERIGRPNPFAGPAAVVYVPPGSEATITAETDSELALGSAPAEGRYAARVVRPESMTDVVRGGANAVRHVVDTFGPRAESERLISYECWVPRGNWTGWPPHRHDGLDGSPYLEETYYYRFDSPAGFGIHRNFDQDRDYDELTLLRDRSLVPVPKGFHMCGCGPSSNAWILNFLAGPVEDRTRPPHFDPRETWIENDWFAGHLQLPAFELSARGNRMSHSRPTKAST